MPEEGPSLRDQAGDELRRLRQAAGASEDERRELLSDLGSRLTALVRHLTSTGTAVPDELRELAAALADDAPLGLPADELAALWERTIATLERLAGSRGEHTRAEFWKG
jgi:hypothetical protein